MVTKVSFIRWLKNYGHFYLILISKQFPNFVANNLNYRRVDLDYHHCGCTSIYRSLSYPLRSLSESNNTMTKMSINSSLKRQLSFGIPILNDFQY